MYKQLFHSGQNTCKHYQVYNNDNKTTLVFLIVVTLRQCQHCNNSMSKRCQNDRIVRDKNIIYIYDTCSCRQFKNLNLVSVEII